MIPIPCVIVDESNAVGRVFNWPEDFEGPDGVRHPSAVWASWTPDGFAERCPGWTARQLIDEAPSGTGKRAERLPQDQWRVGANAVTVAYELVDLTVDELAAQAGIAEAALKNARAAAVAANNAAAGRVREAYLTAVPGQETTYAAKQGEVARWVAEGRPADVNPEFYPWAGDRAELRNVTAADVLAEWQTVTNGWEAIGRQIEKERERVNDMIAASGSLADIEAARMSAVYPSSS
ncbi:hypothetical protein [Azospirillum agricola]|uniref:hypothetical protein n=1 Tax=Azospirillum agricola TaxID=1720247 RepID=UPI000A0F158E|nr:hypothetical protein [Azospirillum agricola]SMH59488.1 hypothetical protein SAMN02982994_5075 [Azospirillum lipoferum]